MSASDNLERLVAEWLTATAATPAPTELHDDLLTVVRRSRQHPRWLARARIRATGGSRTLRLAGRAALVVAAIALLVLALLAIALFAGSQRRPPPPFGPAGNGLMAFDADGAIYTADADGNVSVRVPRDRADHTVPSWSPNGEQLAYWTTSDTDRWLSVVSGAGQPVDIRLDSAMEPHPGKPEWSPDSRSLVFAATTPAGERLEIVDLATSTIREITLEDTDAQFPMWSPDGQWIAYYGTVARTGQLRLSLVHPDGTGILRLPTSVLPTAMYDLGEFAWSPDPHVSQLLYVFNVNGVGDIALFDVSTGREVIVSEEIANEFWPTWSPDGRHIAWYYGVNNNEAEVRVADIGPGPTVTGIRSVLTSPRAADGEGPNCGDTPSLAGRFICQRPEWSPDRGADLRDRRAGHADHDHQPRWRCPDPTHLRAAGWPDQLAARRTLTSQGTRIRWTSPYLTEAGDRGPAVSEPSDRMGGPSCDDLP